MAVIILGYVVVVGGLFSLIYLAVKPPQKSQKHVLQVKNWLKVGGGSSVIVIVVGACLVIIGAYVRGGSYSLQPESEASQTAPPAQPTASPTPSVDLAQEAFTTPSRNVFCSTYKNKPKMGCVITKHTWGKLPECKYLYAITAEGETQIEPCTDEGDLQDLMTDIRPPRLAEAQLGTTLDFGVSTCTVSKRDVTRCANLDGRYFELSPDKSDHG